MSMGRGAQCGQHQVVSTSAGTVGHLMPLPIGEGPATRGHQALEGCHVGKADITLRHRHAVMQMHLELPILAMKRGVSVQLAC